MARGPRLRNLAELESFLARLLRETYQGRVDPGLAGRLAFIANSLRACMEAQPKNTGPGGAVDVRERRLTLIAAHLQVERDALREQLAGKGLGTPPRDERLPPGATGSPEHLLALEGVEKEWETVREEPGKKEWF